jgi:glycosyltransferase involved in cell wall biosynthesis
MNPVDARPLHIVVTAYVCSPIRGGEAGHGWNWSTGYGERGHTVDLITSDRYADELAAATGSPEVRVHVLPGVKAWLPGRFGMYADYLGWQWRARTALRALAARQPVHVVHHVCWGSLFWGTRVTARGVPLVFGPVGGGQVPPRSFASVFGSAWRHQRTRRFALDHLLRANPLARTTMRRAALVFATNAATASRAQGLGARRVVLMLDSGTQPEGGLRSPNADAGATAPMRPAGTPLRVLWVGRLLPHKAVILALEAFGRYAARRSGTLTIVGDGPHRALAEEWVDRHDLADRVTLRGQLPLAEVASEHAAADVFLFTSLQDSFGTQVLEAMAAGLPIVTLDHHGVRDFVPADAGVRVPVSSPATAVAGLADALVGLADDPDRRAIMGARAQAAADEHGWPAKVATAEALIRAAIGDAAPAG